jgi:hypothetical protein
MEKFKVGDSVMSCMFRYGLEGVVWTGITFSKVTQVNDAKNLTLEFEVNGQKDWVTCRKEMVRKKGICKDCKHRLSQLVSGVCPGIYKKLRKK